MIYYNGIYISLMSLNLLCFRRLVQEILSVQSGQDPLHPQPQGRPIPQLDSELDNRRGEGCCWNYASTPSKTQSSCCLRCLWARHLTLRYLVRLSVPSSSRGKNKHQDAPSRAARHVYVRKCSYSCTHNLPWITKSKYNSFPTRCQQF